MLDGGEDAIDATENTECDAGAVDWMVAEHVGGVFLVRTQCEAVLGFAVGDARAEERWETDRGERAGAEGVLP